VENDVSDNNVIDIYDWHRPLKTGELPRACVLAELYTPPETETKRKMRPSELALAGTLVVLVSLLIATFKLMIAGNHKPGLRTVDEAIRRRFNLIPFTVTIPPEERDPDLGEKLKAEWPAILQWMIDGCLEWQKRGLAPPEAVTTATDAYLEAQDAFSAWLDECCERDPNAWERSMTLFPEGEMVHTQPKRTRRILSDEAL
jgi:hypothetical protein